MFACTNWPSDCVEQTSAPKKLCRECDKNHASTNCVTNMCKECCDAENKDYLFCPRHQLRRPLKASKDVKFSTKLKILPPWTTFPDYPR